MDGTVPFAPRHESPLLEDHFAEEVDEKTTLEVRTFSDDPRGTCNACGLGACRAVACQSGRWSCLTRPLPGRTVSGAVTALPFRSG